MGMRIIHWNCQGAFRLKNKEVLELKPDILIVPECEQEQKLEFGKLTPRPKDFLWYGDTGKKGIAIFSYSNYTFRLLNEFNQNFRYIVPLEVTDGTNSFLLFAVWAMDNKLNPLTRYIGQVWNAINYYQTILKENSILIGDFNSNTIWDNKKDRVATHSDVVEFLNLLKIESLYHKHFSEKQGKESMKTYFMHRNIRKPYHIDYIFASPGVIKNGYNLQLETSEKWIDKSDHVPIILDITQFESKVNIRHTFIGFTKRHLLSLSELTKIKFREEISTIENQAEALDINAEDKATLAALINDIETLKQIDKLIARLNKTCP